MFSSLLGNWKIISIIVVILGSSFFGLKLYINNLQDDIETLKENNHTLKTDNKVNIKTIDNLSEQNKKNFEEINSLQKRLEENELYKQDLIDKLQNHDLTKLSAKKPGLIENRINNATKELFDEFETITSK